MVCAAETERQRDIDIAHAWKFFRIYQAHDGSARGFLSVQLLSGSKLPIFTLAWEVHTEVFLGSLQGEKEGRVRLAFYFPRKNSRNISVTEIRNFGPTKHPPKFSFTNRISINH